MEKKLHFGRIFKLPPTAKGCKCVTNGDFEVIGAGGYGKIFSVRNNPNMVIKASYTSKECTSAEQETKTQTKIRNMLLRKVPEVHVAEVYNFWNLPTIIMGEEFQCAFQMERLPSIPLGLLWEISPGLKERTPESTLKYLEEKNMGLMLHVTFQLMQTKIFPKDLDLPMSDFNPPRGVMMGADGKEIDNLIEMGLWDIGIPELKRIMGRIYGLIFFLGFFPKDIEFALGLNSNGLIQLNLMDFGLVEELEGQSASEIQGEIAMDIYLDVEDDPDGAMGWFSGLY